MMCLNNPIPITSSDRINDQTPAPASSDHDGGAVGDETHPKPSPLSSPPICFLDDGILRKPRLPSRPANRSPGVAPSGAGREAEAQKVDPLVNNRLMDYKLGFEDGMEIYLAAGFRGRRSIPCPRAPHFIAAKLMLKMSEWGMSVSQCPRDAAEHSGEGKREQ
ncbi:hypothetical protein MUK42_34187 [Musa troglodytarum]|uniref:Uncharacterized protein n=1 Tax=Musa troglodytarum TaxID=320322 RepID=A0A9E7K527_9LILI|nr:hypothetical protein MUK42_34187 [Musa troglodytarum]URE03561.1 hypothetical protein MUK42_34187 [Musa troglodytarum]